MTDKVVELIERLRTNAKCHDGLYAEAASALSSQREEIEHMRGAIFDAEQVAEECGRPEGEYLAKSISALRARVDLAEAALVAMQERCTEICDAQARGMRGFALQSKDRDHAFGAAGAEACAAAIRALGKGDTK